MKPAEQFSLLFLWGYFDLIFFSLASWTLRPLRLVRKISGTLVEDAREMQTHQSLTESKWCMATCCITFTPTATTCLRTLFGLSCFFLSFFLFVLFHMSNLKLILLTCLLVMSWRVQQKKKKLILSIRQISLPLNLFKDLCKANLQLKCQTCSQNSKDPEDKALSLAEDQMPVYATFMTCLSWSVSEILGLIELVDVVYF